MAPCTVRRVHVLSQSSDDDDENGIDSRWKDVLQKLGDSSAVGPEIPPLESLQDLESTIKSQGYQKTPISRQFKDKNYVQSSDFALNSDSLSQLENILGAQLYSDMDDDEEEDDLAGNDSRSVVSWTTNNDVDDALFLDAESYLSYSSGDGGPEDFVNTNYNFDSTRTGAIPPSLGKNFIEFAMPPDAPYYSNNNVKSNDNNDNKNGSNQEVTMADILALQQTMAQRRPPSPEEEKAIFAQVFQGEQAYFEKTSNMFREGLTNKTAAQTATFMRRNKQYRKNLLRELNKLEKQIQDFEVLLETDAGRDHLPESKDNVKKEYSGTTTTIDRANSQFGGKSEKAEVLLDEYDDNTELGLESSLSDDLIEEWVLVDDPSTGKTFLWNSKTDEMKDSLGEQNDS